MKYIVFVLLSTLSLCANAIRLNEITAAISCNSIPDNAFFMREFKKEFGAPQIKNGAAWFKAPGEMYGYPVKEVFVSTTAYTFVGIVIDGKPTDVIKNIPISNQYPTNVFPSGSNMWVGADGREIVWHAGKYTKMFCGKGTF